MPSTYKQQLYIDLNSLEQKYDTVQQYTREFDKLYMACGCKDDEEQKIAKYILGLHPKIRDKVELQSFSTYDECCLLASKIERQQNSKSSRFSWVKPSYTSPNDETKEKDESGASSTKSDQQKKDKTVPSKQSDRPKWFVDKGAARKTICFKCQGHGHVQNECPSRFLITRDEHISCLQQDQTDDDNEVIDAYPEDDSNMLLLQVDSTPSQHESSPPSVSTSTTSKPRFKVGDYIYLTEEGEERYYNQTSYYVPPLGEGPYQVLKSLGRGKLKVMLALNNNFNFHYSELVPCDDDYPP